MADDATLDLTLTLRSVDELFGVPDITPLSDDYQVHGSTAGIEFVVDELSADPSRRRVHLTLALPDAARADAVEEDIAAAVTRYAKARMAKVDHQIRAIRWRGIRALTLSFIALFVFIGLSKLVDSDTSVFWQVISEGLSIAGWVALWFPLELLSFTVWEQRVDKRVLRTLAATDITVVPRRDAPAGRRPTAEA